VHRKKKGGGREEKDDRKGEEKGRNRLNMSRRGFKSANK
jgi:hypothetical protein